MRHSVLVYCFDTTDETIFDFLRLFETSLILFEVGDDFLVHIADNLLVVIVAFVLLFTDELFDVTDRCWNTEFDVFHCFIIFWVLQS